MADILAEIVARKRIDVAERFRDAAPLAPPPTNRSLKAALAQPGARFVMEVKRASPSEGTLRTNFDPAAQARAYAVAADAISVLTDAPFFGGSLDDLRAVRSVYDGPILAKDFMIDPRQVAETRQHGADAILVMMSVLDDADAAAMVAEARRFGMDALVEAHSADEVRRAVALGAGLIGINNRDLRTLKVDLATTERLAGLIPADRIIVAESGIANRADVARLARHADAFLIGTALMRADDPAMAARALAFGRVKVCGLTDAHDVSMATQAGASFAGLVMVPHTPRAVSLREAEAIAANCEDARFVGVFRDEKPLQVAASARLLGLRAVQLHGAEDAGYIRALRALLPDACEIWAAAAIGIDAPDARSGADRTLFDTQVNGRSGGTGRTFDWSRIEGRPDLVEGILAGGLTPGNAGAASKVGAYALDVSSGVECAPGRKDGVKLRAFFEAVRMPARSDAHAC